MEILELTITSCLHLVRSAMDDTIPRSIGSGVVVRYKERYFICTVSHFSDHEHQNVGIITGRKSEKQTEVLFFGEFSYLTQIKFDDVPNVTDLEYNIQNPEVKGTKLDIAFKEITLLDNIYQHERILELDGLGTLTVSEGGKAVLIVDDQYEIEKNEICSFYGRIRPRLVDGILHFEEQLYWGLPIKNIGEFFIELDLGAPIADHTRFKGCSGAPIIDTRGRLIGLVTHGEDLSSCSIYGFRFDKVKQWIDLMYFQEPLASM